MGDGVELKDERMNELKPKLQSKEPPKLELKQLPLHSRYSFLGKNLTFSIVINGALNNVQEEKPLNVLREHKMAIEWTIANIKGINPSICMQKILMKESYKLIVQPLKKLNPSMQEMEHKEVLMLLDASIIYPILVVHR